MIATLPMYDRPETAAAHDVFWTLIRDRLRNAGIAAPDALNRGPDLWAEWTAPDLLLGQTCNLPFRARLHPRVSLVGNPDYALPGTPPGHYHSVFVTRSGDSEELHSYANRPMAVNDAMSHSGWAAPSMAAAALGFAFSHPLETGAHSASAAAVAEGRADIAAIDAHTWRAITAYDPEVANALQVIGRTAASPAPPFVTAFADLVVPLHAALAGAIATLPGEHRAMLGLSGLVPLPLAAHLSLPIPPDPWANAPKTGDTPA